MDLNYFEFEFDEENSNCSIVAYKGEETDILVPSEVENGGKKYRVHGIEGAFKGNKKITSVVISDGVEVVGNEAFGGCMRLASVTLPDSITELGCDCFRGCVSLKEIVIPKGVTSIPPGAFIACHYLDSVTLPAGLTSIDNCAFAACLNLKNISLPENLEYIGRAAFENCTSLEEIDIPSNVSSISSETFNKCYNLKHVNFENNIISEIGRKAFNRCYKLTDIDLSTNYIGPLAFYYCIGLKELKVLEAVMEVDYSAFECCLGLTRLWLEDYVKPMFDDQFANCVNLVDVELDDIQKTNASTFNGCVKLEGKYRTDDPIRKKGNRYAISQISDKSSEEDIVFNNYVYGKVGIAVRSVALAFKGLVLYMGKTVDEAIYTINQTLQSKDIILAYESDEFKSFVSSVAKKEDMGKYSSFKFSKYVNNKLKNYEVFVNTHKVETKFNDFLPEMNVLLRQVIGARYLYEFAVDNTPEDVKIQYKDKNGVTKRKEIVHFDAIPDLAIKIGDEDVRGECDFIVEGYILRNCRYDEGECDTTSQFAYVGPDRSRSYLFLNGINERVSPVKDDKLSSATKKTSIRPTPVENFEISYGNDGTCSIRKFSKVNRNVIIPKNVDEKGKTYTVTSIESDAFRDRKNLECVIIPDSVTKIGTRAFYGCPKLTSIIVPDSVTKVPGLLIYDKGSKCYGWVGDDNECKEVTIPDGVTEIGTWAFYGCRSLTSIIVPDSVTKIRTRAFWDCPLVPGLFIYDKGSKCYGWVGDKNKCKEVSIPDGVTAIGEYAFEDCRSLKSITIPDGVTEIGEWAFYGCTSLESITIPDSVTKIDSNAFYGCTRLKSINIPDSVTKIGGGAFDGCTSLTSINIPDGVTKIDSNAFSDCRSLKSITIPDGVTEIGYGAFSRCRSLKSITIPDSVTKIDEHAFSGCTSLKSITIPDSVTKIGERTFRGCTSLTSITIPDSVAVIGESAFSGCTSLTSINIPKHMIETTLNLFDGCDALPNEIKKAFLKMRSSTR